jgi:hypothetical protein
MYLSYNQSTGVQWAWDATSIKLAIECPRKYYYKNLCGWRPTNLSPHLKFGQHYATALEHYFKHRLLEDLDHEQSLTAVIHEALIDTWDYKWEEVSEEAEEENGLAKTKSSRRRVPGSGYAWQSSDVNKTRENLIRTIVWYLDEFQLDGRDPTKVAVLDDGAPAVELSFQLPVDNDITFCGHLDRLVLMDDIPYVMDQKTSKSTIAQYWFDQFKPDDQMSLYTFAGSAIFATPVAGVIIDAAQIAVGFSRFERGFTHRTQDELNEWYDMTMTNIQTIQAYTRENNFPMRSTSCGNYGGCEFRRVCAMSPQFRDQALRADFKKERRWDPLERR